MPVWRSGWARSCVWAAGTLLGLWTAVVHHLGAFAPSVVSGYGHALSMLAVCYGVPVWGFTVLWSALALALTVRQVRDGLPVAPTWWSFTFPVGTVATGSSALASATGLALFEIGAGIATLALGAGWFAAAYATLRLFTDQAALPRGVAQGVRGQRQRLSPFAG
ncbi:hypothetical protein ACIA03_28565 [Nocardioides sp. NPDC051685]|uniref:SLAC1 family transporter n=1 Tax=Nocardioides sp. NPDC051685 TaxID=3364334 RepID=UPI0037BB6862